MASASPEGGFSNSVQAARVIDERCDRFEKDWLAGGRPAIEPLLADLPAPVQRSLLEELLPLDVHYRRQGDETPSVEDYASRFPELDASLVEKIVRETFEGAPGRSSAGSDQLTEIYGKAPAPSASEAIRYFGDYELISEIARGGMGVVYKARQTSLNRLVAVKMILSGQFAAEVEIDRFRGEAESAARLDHPNIVAVYEIGEHEGYHFFSMALVDGQSLASELNNGPLEPRRAAEIVRQAALAVQYAHEKGVIHRDLKPSNILLDREGRPRVTDFGLAKRVSEATGPTMTGDVLGTPSYMPPEQAAGRIDAVSPASDVYALGAVLYAVLSGRPPFQSASSVDTLRQVMDRDPVAPRQLNPAIPRDLETIVLKCLEKSLPRRYSTARELADELQCCLDGRPILARPVSRPERAWRWFRRNPVVGSLAAVTFVLVTVVAAVSSIAYLREANLTQALSQRSRDLKKRSEDLSAALQREQGLVVSERKATGDAIAAKNEEEQARIKAQQAEAKEREQRFTAERQTRLAESHRLAVQAQSILNDYPDRALLLATEAVTLAKVNDDPVPNQVELTLRTVLASAHDNTVGGAVGGVPGLLYSADISDDGRWLAATASLPPDPQRTSAEVFLFDLRRWGEDFAPTALQVPLKFAADFPQVRFSKNRRWLEARARAILAYWDLSAENIGDSVRIIPPQDEAESAFRGFQFSPGSRQAFGSSKLDEENLTVSLYSLDADEPWKPIASFPEAKGRWMNRRVLSSSDAWSVQELLNGNIGEHRGELLLHDLAGEDPAREIYLSAGSRTAATMLGFGAQDAWLCAWTKRYDEEGWRRRYPENGPKTSPKPPDRSFVAARHGLCLWDLKTNDRAPVPLSLPEESYGGDDAVAEFSPDGRWLYVVHAVLPPGTKTVAAVDSKGAMIARHMLANGGEFTELDKLEYELSRYDLQAPDISASRHVVFRHDKRVRCILAAADGSWVATGCDDYRVRVWRQEQPPSDKPWKIFQPHSGAVTHLYRTPHLRRFVARCFVRKPSGKDTRPYYERSCNGQCALWDVDASNQIRPLARFDGWNHGPLLSPAASDDGRWWVTGKGVLDTTKDDGPVVEALKHGISDLSPAYGNTGAAQATDRRAAALVIRNRWMLLHPSRSNERFPFALYALKAGPRQLEPRVFNRIEFDGKTDLTQEQATFGADGSHYVDVWARPGSGQPRNSKVYIIRICSCDGDGHWLLTVRAGAAMGLSHWRLGLHSHVFATLVAESSEERKGIDSLLSVWRLDRGAPGKPLLERLKLGPVNLAEATGIAISEDERWLAIGAGDRTVRLFDLENADVTGSARKLPIRESQNMSTLSREAPVSLDFSPDGRWLAARPYPYSSLDSQFWDMQAPDVAASMITGCRHPLSKELKLVAEGTRLLTCGDGRICLWDVSQLSAAAPAQPMGELKSSGKLALTGMIVSADRRWLAWAPDARHVDLWDLTEDGFSTPALRADGIQGEVRSVGFSPDATLLAVLSLDEGVGSLAVWQVVPGGAREPWLRLPLPDSLALQGQLKLSISADNRFLSVGGATGSAIWTLQPDELHSVARRAAGRELTEDERKFYLVPARTGELPPPSAYRLPRSFLAPPEERATGSALNRN